MTSQFTLKITKGLQKIIKKKRTCDNDIWYENNVVMITKNTVYLNYKMYEAI